MPDGTLRVWDLTNDTSRVLRGHAGNVYSIVKLNETTIVSASGSTLRVWNLTNDTSRVLRGHAEWVTSVVKQNETTVVSGSRDCTLRVWDLTNDTSRVFEGHTRSVWSMVKLNETTVVSASTDETLRVWDLTNGTSPGVKRTHGFGPFGDQIERDHDCQCKFGWYVAGVVRRSFINTIDNHAVRLRQRRREGNGKELRPHAVFALPLNAIARSSSFFS